MRPSTPPFTEPIYEERFTIKEPGVLSVIAMSFYSNSTNRHHVNLIISIKTNRA